MKADLHSHTAYSKDGVTKPVDYLKMASQRVDAIAVTDHDTMKGYFAMKKMNPPVALIPGEEVSTDLGDIIGLFLQEEIKPKSSLEVIDEIRRQGGVVVLPHPFDMYRGFGNIDYVIKKVDCLEVFNSRVTFAFENSKAMDVAKGAMKGMTAGSDAHTKGEIGFAYVEWNGDMESLRKAIISGKAATKGRLSPPYVHLASTLAKFKRKKALNGQDF
ncbi:MAG: PHP domain-containing protein [Candidatus Aenigmarchaeota archaeon]|nr:PHP domain-containing protein [Candidatus Aenigmarchaeota archaeon]